MDGGRWSCGGSASQKATTVGFEVSHPFRDETAKWMGHGAVVVGRLRKRQRRLGFEVSHPFRDETTKWMGHGAGAVGRLRRRQIRMRSRVATPFSLRDGT